MKDSVNGYILKLSLLLLVLLIGTYALTASQYKHPMPEQDCSTPNDYPVCSIAHTPVQIPETPLVLLLMGSAVGGALILLLTIASYLATVRPQENAVIQSEKIQGPSKVKEVFP